ncbi:MAG: hypothetical protein JW940_21375 [Polyangiaceae bacterium]|nr:hypothetical protein [Polyangiaceae bacterium]
MTCVRWRRRAPARWVPWEWCLWQACAILGCAGPGCAGRSAASHPTDPARVVEGSALEQPSGSPNAARAQDPEAVLAGQTPVVASGDPRLVLVLPEDAAFVAQPLAEGDPARAASFRERARIHVGLGYLDQLDLFPGERALLVSSQAEGSVRVYDRDSRRLLGNFAPPGARPWSGSGVLAWPELAPDATPLFVTASGDVLALWSATTGARLASLGSADGRLRWSPDRKILVTSASGGPLHPPVLRFHRRDRLTLAPVGSLVFDERVDASDLSRDNRLLALALYPSGALRVLDLYTGADVLRIAGPQFAGDVALSPDGRWVAAGGAGLLVVDLLNSARRAFYSHVYNNIGCVRFSPSGDLLAASSYDGRVRLFRIVEPPARQPDDLRRLELELVAELRHAGRANVYAVVFEADGQGLVSASGDQTVRWFRVASPSRPSPPPTRRFRNLEQWRRDDPAGAAAWPDPEPPAFVGHHYQTAALQGPPRPTRLRPGRYACKIAAMYRLRECLVTQDERGHTLLEFMPTNLLGVTGVVHDDGSVARFEGWLTRPSTLIDCEGCDRQPIHGLLRGDGRSYRGVLTFRNYYDPHRAPAPPAVDVKIEEALDRYPVELRYQGPLRDGERGTNRP